MRNAKKPTVSLCMIVKDEKALLGRCLESVRDVVDEIVLVDTGSSDGTIQIAHQFKAKVFEHSWREDFSDARNVSLDHATSDWILFLDADEVLERKSAQRWAEVLPRTTHFGFFFCIVNITENGAVSGKHYTVRLFRNLRGVRFTGKIHEHVIPMGTRAYAGMTIYHYGYDLEPAIMKRKKERNVRILEQTLTERREDPVLRYHLANTYRLLGETEKALAHGMKGMELTEKDKEKNALYLTILQVMVEVYLQRGEWDTAEAYCIKALAIRDDFIDALYSLACIYRLRQDYRKTILTYYAFLEKKRHIDAVPEQGLFFPCLTSWGKEGDVRNDLGGVFFENGNLDRAIEEVSRAIALFPRDAKARYNLGIALSEKGLLKEAGECFQKALELQTVYPEAEKALERIKGFSGS